MSKRSTHAVAQHPPAGNRGWEVAIGRGLKQICQDATEANAERIAACWNACQGIDTADLKAGSVSIIHKLHDEAAQRVLEQRDELLSALNQLKATDFGANVKTADDERHMDSVAAFARAAIAKVEGGATP